MSERLDPLLAFLAYQRIDAVVEKRAQADLESALADGGWQFSREHRLSDQDVPDFLVTVEGVSVVVELKIRAQRKRIFRQLERYALHDSVDTVVLLTGTAMQLPPEIRGKPARVISLGAGWL